MRRGRGLVLAALPLALASAGAGRADAETPAGRIRATESVESTTTEEPVDSDAPRRQTAETILAAQPLGLRERLDERGMVLLQEIREEGSLSGGLLMALVVFELPIDEVWAYFEQTERQVEFQPELESIVILEEHPDGRVAQHELKILFQSIVYHLRYRLDPVAQRIAWELDDRYENDLGLVEGFWDLYAMDDARTLGRFGTRVDVGPAIPAFLQDWLTRNKIPTTMENARLWINSRGRYRP